MCGMNLMVGEPEAQVAIPFIRHAAADAACALPASYVASMQIDTAPVDECKQGGGDALLSALQAADAAESESLQQPTHGQMQIS